MTITIVMDQYGDKSNGTTATAMHLAAVMREHGHTVRIVTSMQGVDEENVYVVPKRTFPLVMKFIRSQGMEFGKPDENVLIDAIGGADLVHFYLPFKLEKVGKQIADKLGVPSTAAFHVQPENITSSVKCGKIKPLNDAIYFGFKSFYNQFEHIHCPSRMLADILDAHGYTAQKHVISNGYNEFFHKVESVRPPELEGKYVITMSGRLSREKRQDLIIEAAASSKYRDRIGLVFCGRGPWEKKLRKLAEKLLPKDNRPVFKFCSQEELRDVLCYSDLYVHASDAEIEAISCMEAFACGLVPVISDSPTTATKQFALDERNLFQAGKSESLRDKIDYFIEHPEEKAELSERYTEYAKQFRVENCVKEMEKMFETAVAENRAKFEEKKAEAI